MTEEQKTIKTARDIMRRGVGYVVSDDDFERVGMSLKSVGIPEAEIDTFMSNNPNYDAEAKKRIHSFSGNGARGIATLIKWAQDTFNYKVPRELCTSRMNLTDYPTNTERQQNAVTGAASASVMLPRYEPREVPQTYADLDPMAQLHKFVNALYESGEYIQICTAAALDEEKQKWKPAANGVMLSRENLAECGNLEALQHGAGGISGIGTINEAAGVWVRVNPVNDANGKNESVSRFGHLLIECDEASLQDQWGAIVQSRLPIDCVISSGVKSLHAWIRVDATDKAAYDAIARRVYDLLERHGIHPDPLCKNAGRFSRLPGMMRGEQMQSLIALREDLPNAYPNISEWLAHEDELIAEAEEAAEVDYLPAAVKMGTNWSNKKLPDCIIGNIVAPGHVAMIAGDPKAGKTWLMQYLAVCAATGKPWIGHKIAADESHPYGQPIKALFINTEDEREEFEYRLAEVAKSLGLNNEQHRAMIDSNLDMIFAHSVEEDLKMWEKELKRKIKKGGYKLVIVDPVWAAMDGDENLTKDVRPYVNVCKRLSKATNTALFISHHHRKGDMRKIGILERAAGSNAWMRHNACIIDLCAIPEEWLEDYGVSGVVNGGIETTGIHIEYCGRRKMPQPADYWRSGAEWRIDTTGLIHSIWRDKTIQRDKEDIKKKLKMLLGDKITIIGKSANDPYFRTNASANDSNIYTGAAIEEETPKNTKNNILCQFKIKACPLTVAELERLTGKSISTVKGALKKLIDEGILEKAEEGRQGVSGEGTKYFVTAAHRNEILNQ